MTVGGIAGDACMGWVAFLFFLRPSALPGHPLAGSEGAASRTELSAGVSPRCRLWNVRAPHRVDAASVLALIGRVCTTLTGGSRLAPMRTADVGRCLTLVRSGSLPSGVGSFFPLLLVGCPLHVPSADVTIWLCHPAEGCSYCRGSLVSGEGRLRMPNQQGYSVVGA